MDAGQEEISMDKIEGVLSVLDVAYQFSPAYIGRVTGEALHYREQVSQGARDSLNAAINNSSIRLDGFRDTSKADADTLVDPVFDQILAGNERLIRSVLRTWMECRAVLQGQVVEELSKLGVGTDGLKGKGDEGVGIWEEEDWAEKFRIIQSEIGDAEAQDVRLMMTCVSGMAPDLPEEEEVESDLFKGWMEQLRELPADAPEWFEMDVFVRQMEELAQAKAGAMIREHTERLGLIIQDTQEKFGDELGYLEIDLSVWLEESKEHPVVLPAAASVAEALHDSLLEYMKLKPIARTRSEELERRVLREQCEDSIFGLASKWAELVEDAKSMEKELMSSGEDEEALAEESDDVSSQAEEAHTPSGEAKIEVEETQQVAAAMAELEAARQEIEGLRSEKAAVETEGRGLQVKLTGLEGEVDRLRRELYESRQTEKVWREQFVSVSKSVGDEKSEEPDEIGDVEDAVERARRAFPQQLVIAPNSKSDLGTPFQRPEEVYNVLAWLGTEYHRARTGEAGRDPQFDKLLKEACSGWFYKPKQTDETKDQFPEWYRTRVDDREFELDAHVGKGTSFDPQNTIRIAFDWDDEAKRVVVGYIGRHQKNRRS